MLAGVVAHRADEGAAFHREIARKVGAKLDAQPEALKTCLERIRNLVLSDRVGFFFNVNAQLEGESIVLSGESERPEFKVITREVFRHLPGAFFYIQAPTLLEFFLFYVVLFAILFRWLPARPWRVPAVAGFAVLLGVACGSRFIEARTPRLTLLPVNGGEAVYWHAPGKGGEGLADTGDTNAVGLVTKGFLRAQGVNWLPHLLLTHGDIRHMGGAGLVADGFAARKIHASPLRFRSPVYRQVLDVGLELAKQRVEEIRERIGTS